MNMFLPFSPCKNSLIRSVVLLLMISSQIVFSMASGSGSFHQKTFHQLSNVHFCLEKTLGVWKHADVAKCALLCTMIPKCTGFRWKRSKETCITGYKAVANTNGDSDSDNSVKFFTTLDHLCRYDLGYQLLSDGTHERCVYLSKRKAKHAKAKQLCQALGGGRLYKANLPELNMLLSELVIDRVPSENGLLRIIIGLDDIARENAFIWSDGTEMTQDEMRSLLGPGEPNGRESENCIEMFIYPDRNYLVDHTCNFLAHFACETDV